MKLHVTLAYNTDALRGASLTTNVVVLPELVDGGYAALRRGSGIHTMDDEYMEEFRSISRRHGCTCIAGSNTIRNGHGLPTNTSMVFRNGKRVHRYDKIHLFKPAGEERLFQPGRQNKPFTVLAGRSRIRAGVIVCYDLRFPELARMLAAGGIQVLFVPARWPLVRDDAWQTLLKARAIENQVFVVGCNAKGKEGGFSYIFDPIGEPILDSRDDPDAALREAVLDLDRIKDAHAMHRNLRDAVLLQKIRFPLRIKY